VAVDAGLGNFFFFSLIYTLWYCFHAWYLKLPWPLSGLLLLWLRPSRLHWLRPSQPLWLWPCHLCWLLYCARVILWVFEYLTN
jgi:hypothetical protein